jgi:hypothetical protein
MRSSAVVLSIFGAMAMLGCPQDNGNGSGEGSSSSSSTTATTMTTLSGSATLSTSDTTTASTGASTTTTDASSSETGTTAADSSGSGSTGSGSSGGSSGSSDTGHGMGSNDAGNCAHDQESCLDVMCCGNLECCMGVPIPDGQAICYMQCPDSDRNIKHAFDHVDVDRVLDQVATLPITTWTYDDDPSGARHIGPMAQDFQATFGVGGSDKAIAKVDADGVALASVQALHRRVQTLQSENDELRASVAALEARLAKLERR